MKNSKHIILAALAVVLLFSISCDENGDILLFSIQNDIELGNEVAAEIAANPEEYPILDPADYPEAYAYLEGMMNEILASDEISYRDVFAWKVNIIDSEIQNAFATPGGQLYFYTGLIYTLDKEDDLAGILGHEIAHSDQRHSSKQLQQTYGISILLSILAGDESSTLTEITSQIAGTLAGLAFSRDAENEADEYSVRYLADTDYACNGAAAFFEKMSALNDSGVSIELLSTHPEDEDRIENINNTASSIGCSTSVDEGSVDRFTAFKNLLP